MTDFVARLPDDLDDRLLPLADVPGLPSVLSVSSGFSEDRADGSEFDYLHGVATTVDDLPGDLDVLDVAATRWVVLEATGDVGDEQGATEFRSALQQLWADAFSQWFPAHPDELAPGPEILQVRPDPDATPDGTSGPATARRGEL